MAIDLEKLRKASRPFIEKNEAATPNNVIDEVGTAPEWVNFLLIVYDADGKIRAAKLSELAAIMTHLGPDAFDTAFDSLPLRELGQVVDELYTVSPEDKIGEVLNRKRSYIEQNPGKYVAFVDQQGFLGYDVGVSAGSDDLPGERPLTFAEVKPATTRSMPRKAADCPCVSHLPKNMTCSKSGSSCPHCGAFWDIDGILRRAGVCPES